MRADRTAWPASTHLDQLALEPDRQVIRHAPHLRVPKPMQSSPGSTGNCWKGKTEEAHTLNSSRSGSISSNCRSSGRPPTLWWLLMVWLCFWPLPGGGHDSMTSGYRVPCRGGGGGGEAQGRLHGAAPWQAVRNKP